MSPTATSQVPRGWLVAGDKPKSYEMSLCTSEKYSGTRCAQIKSIARSINGFGTLMQSFDARKYRGKRLKLTAFVKAKDVAGWAGLWMRIDGDNKQLGFDNMQDRPIKGTADWKQYEIELDVPPQSTNISYGLLLCGTGTVWLDGIAFEESADKISAENDLKRSCGVRFQNEKAINLDFSQGLRGRREDKKVDMMPVGWFTDKKDDNCTITLERDGEDKGCAACLECPGKLKDNCLLQSVSTKDYAGKRLKFSADIKTDTDKGTGGLFFRTDTGWDLVTTHDYMEGREISGTADWQNYNCVIDVPPDSDNIYLGCWFQGKGSLRFKNCKLEIVTDDTPTTGNAGSIKQKENVSILSAPTNLDFSAVGKEAYEVTRGWFAAGNKPDHYDMQRTKADNFTGQIDCVFVVNRVKSPAGFSTLMQQVRAGQFQGKRLQLSADIKTENSQHSALWMRVDGKNGELLGFDNMNDYPIMGTTDWSTYKCVLDVPEESKMIAYGVIAQGKGKTWLSNVKLEEVSKDVPTTNMEGMTSKSRPQNLDFEED